MKLFSGSPRIGRVAAFAALIVLVLSVFQFTVSAQDELEDTFTSESGSYQISFPDGWTVEEDSAGSFITVEGDFGGDSIVLLVFDPDTFTTATSGVTDLTEAAEVITSTNEAFSGTPEVFEIGSRDVAVVIAEIEGLSGLSFTVEFDNGAFGFMVVFQEGDNLSVIEENAETIFAIVESYNVAGSDDSDDSDGGSSSLGGLLGGGGDDEDDSDEGSGGLGGVLGGGGADDDGDSAIGDTCAEFPLNILNAYQYGIVDPDDGTPLLVYNIGCDGFMTYSIADTTSVIEYDITSDGVLSFRLSETTYTTTSVDEEEWVVESNEGGTIPLTRIDDDGICDSSGFAALIRGTWVIGSGSDEVIFDFTCNGILLLTVAGETQAGVYEFDEDSGDLFIDLDGNELALSDVEIDGDTMEAIDSTNSRLTFANSVESE